MGIFKKTAADNIEGNARRAHNEGHSVFVAQFRGAVSHTPSLTRPISGMAERIEAVEDAGWKIDQFTAVPYKGNITVVALFRRQDDGQLSAHQGIVEDEMSSPRPPPPAGEEV